jgi:phosphate transport system substrate-binding protein
MDANGRPKARLAPAGAGRALLGTVLLLTVAGCGGDSGRDRGARKAGAVIQNSGSDTMVNLAQVWAEEYRRVEPAVSVEVSGGGSGIGVRDLSQGIIQIANCSREMTAAEKEQTRKNTGKEAVEWIVGYDAIAIYAHRDNPMAEITMEQLAGIYGEGGAVEKWSQLGVSLAKDRIIRVSRQNSSGTYAYFRERVLAKRDFKLSSLDMSGSKDVVELVGRTPWAIGYSGMGYKTEAVKFLKVAAKAGAPGFAPTVEHVRDKRYPLARSLLLYTLGQPEGHVKKYTDWILSPAGQELVRQAGYVPVSAAGASEPRRPAAGGG